MRTNLPAKDPHWWRSWAETEDLGKALRIYRAEAGLNQKQLGLHLGISNRYVSSIERGNRAVSFHLAFRFHKLLGVPLDLWADGNGAVIRCVTP